MTDDGIDDVPGVGWGISADDIHSVDGGMNSAVWRVTAGDGVFYLKGVTAADEEPLRAGAETAARLARAGLRSGAPRSRPAGDLVFVDGARAWALLEEVAGRPLTTSPSDQRLWGTALGRAHRLAPETAGTDPLAWLPIDLDAPDEPAWLRDAVVAIAAELAGALDLTWVRLHTDPEREAFRVDDRGDVGIIDWTGSRPGPALYDLASAVMYAGGASRAAPLVDAYLETGPVPAAEVERGLATFGRLRAVVQGLYFASRVARNDLTGIDDAGENTKGLEDARGMVEEMRGA